MANLARSARPQRMERADQPPTADVSCLPAGVEHQLDLPLNGTVAVPPGTHGSSGAPGASSAPAQIAPLRPTAVYDAFWRFAAERQRVFFARLAGAAPPWTHDAVIAKYKFTNAYRASDRTSQYLIRSVIYRYDLPATDAEIFFRIILFKLFNRIETWQLLQAALGPITYASYSLDAYDAVLERALAAGTRVYSAAYIMPPGRGSRHGRKHRSHLALLEQMMGDELPARMAQSRTMQQGFALLRAYPSIGDFLAYQFVTDVNYSPVTHFSEMEFVVPGPGARDGIRKCFSDRGGLNEPEIIRFMADRQEREFERLGLPFQSLWGRRLQLVDCQNLFCEVDKYARVAYPEIHGHSGRTRIKQRFAPRGSPAAPWYPPKWGLNESIAAHQHAADAATGNAKG